MLNDTYTYHHEFVGKITVDREDSWYLTKHNFFIKKQAYPRTTIRAIEIDINGVREDLHRLLMPCPPHLQVDHIDGNPLNNKKDNLRIVTRHQNSMNRAPNFNKTLPKGVTKRKNCPFNPYMAGIRLNGKFTYIGSYATPEEAKIAYETYASKYFGEFASHKSRRT